MMKEVSLFLPCVCVEGVGRDGESRGELAAYKHLLTCSFVLKVLQGQAVFSQPYMCLLLGLSHKELIVAGQVRHVLQYEINQK